MKRYSPLLFLSMKADAFLLSRERRTSFRASPFVVTPTRPSFILSATQNNKNDEEENQAGMAEAFRELDALKSLDDDDTPKKKKPTAQTPIENVNVEPLKQEPKASPEEEVKLYKDMMSESEKEDVELYADLMTDMGGTTPKPSSRKPKIKIEEEETVELLDSLQKSPEDLDVFMNQALKEALAEANTKSPQELASVNPLDDEELMDEIKQVFEKGNEELLASLEEIRKEQAKLAKATAEENAQSRIDTEAENEKRMELAQASMEKMLQKVNEETAEVERAVQDLKAAQEELAEDPLYKLRSGGIVKQASLVGTALFSVRAITEVIAMSGPNGDAHTLPALIQGAIALVCAAYLFLA